MIAGSAMAGTVAYTQVAFDRLQHDGKPVLVAVHADWCPVCRAQTPIIESLLKQKNYQGVTSLRVDFDNQKDVVRAFRVSGQSTLIVFKDGKEVVRNLGDTSPGGIESLLRKALKE
ncbi:MAG: thioredoxin family protein [Methylotenera sp.]